MNLTIQHTCLEYQKELRFWRALKMQLYLHHASTYWHQMKRRRKRRDIRELLEIHEMITSCWYLSRKASAGRVNIDILDTYIHEYPKTAFLALFGMYKESFWRMDIYAQVVYWLYHPYLQQHPELFTKILAACHDRFMLLNLSLILVIVICSEFWS